MLPCLTGEIQQLVQGMLKLGQLIPSLTARTAEGRVVQSWDFKQKKALVIVFLHAGCRRCVDFLGRLSDRAADLRERDAVALIVFSETPSAGSNFPKEIIVAADVSGRSQRAFLGEEAMGPGGQERVGVFVTDRYGELRAQWSGPHEDVLPQVGVILDCLIQIQMVDEECSPPEWKSEG